jgi:hypothetical protein
VKTPDWIDEVTVGLGSALAALHHLNFLSLMVIDLLQQSVVRTLRSALGRYHEDRLLGRPGEHVLKTPKEGNRWSDALRLRCNG